LSSSYKDISVFEDCYSRIDMSYQQAKKGGGSGFGLLAILGILGAGGIAAAYFMKKKGSSPAGSTLPVKSGVASSGCGCGH
jgi:hypothetical protein